VKNFQLKRSPEKRRSRFQAQKATKTRGCKKNWLQSRVPTLRKVPVEVKIFGDQINAINLRSTSQFSFVSIKKKKHFRKIKKEANTCATTLNPVTGLKQKKQIKTILSFVASLPTPICLTACPIRLNKTHFFYSLYRLINPRVFSFTSRKTKFSAEFLVKLFMEIQKKVICRKQIHKIDS
jgi:hypothetical protein